MGNNPVNFNDPSGLLFANPLNAFAKDPLPQEDATRITNFTNAVGATSAGIAAAPLLAAELAGVVPAIVEGGGVLIQSTQNLLLSSPVLYEGALGLTVAAIPNTPPSLPSEIGGVVGSLPGLIDGIPRAIQLATSRQRNTPTNFSTLGTFESFDGGAENFFQKQSFVPIQRGVASGGFVLYPNKTNSNMLNLVYEK